MDLDLLERESEHPSDRCEVCGATLTQSEIALALEKGGPALCDMHRSEVVELDEDDLDVA
jgi:hypothetical protein